MAGVADMLDDGRVDMDLPCRIITGEHAFPAVLSDVSYDGACLQAPTLPEFLPLGLRAIELDGLGTLDVIFRWRRGDRVGVSFRLEHDARPRLERYFAARATRTGAQA